MREQILLTGVCVEAAKQKAPWPFTEPSSCGTVGEERSLVFLMKQLVVVRHTHFGASHCFVWRVATQR